MDEAQRTDTAYGSTTQGSSFGHGGDSQSGGNGASQSGGGNGASQSGGGNGPTSLMDKAKDQIEPGVDKAKEQLEGGMDKAKEQVDAGLDKAAEGLESTAERIKSMTGEGEGMPAQAGVKVAEGMESAAAYLKEHSSDEIFKDLEVFVKEHPTQALVGAIFAGFMVGRMMR